MVDRHEGIEELYIVRVDIPTLVWPIYLLSLNHLPYLSLYEKALGVVSVGKT